MIPKSAGLNGPGNDGIDWLRAKLRRDPGYDWWGAYCDRRGPRYRAKHHQADHRKDAEHVGADPAALGHDRDDSEIELLRVLFREAVGELRDTRERHVLLRRLNLDGAGLANLAEVGAELGVSRQRVHQLQNKAELTVIQILSHNASLCDVVRRVAADLESEAGVAQFSSWINAAFPHGAAGTIGDLMLRAQGWTVEQTKLYAASVRVFLHQQAEEERRRQELAVRQQRFDETLAMWLQAAEWPDALGAVPAAADLRSSRTIDSTSSSTAGTLTSTKLQRDVAYESSTEYGVLQILERSSLVSYYQEQPCKIPYTDTDGTKRVYHPDLLVVTSDGRGLVLEVKPLLDQALTSVRAKASAGREWAHQQGWGWLMCEPRYPPGTLQQHMVPAAGARAFACRLATGRAMRWPEVRALRDRNEMTALDLAALIVQRNWKWATTPWCERPVVYVTKVKMRGRGVARAVGAVAPRRRAGRG